MFREGARLPEGEIEFGFGRVGQSIGAGVDEDTDDFNQVRLIARKSKLPPNGISAGKIPVSRRLIDDSHSGSVVVVARSKETSFRKFQTERCEVIGSHRTRRQVQSILQRARAGL